MKQKIKKIIHTIIIVLYIGAIAIFILWAKGLLTF